MRSVLFQERLEAGHTPNVFADGTSMRITSQSLSRHGCGTDLNTSVPSTTLKYRKRQLDTSSNVWEHTYLSL